MTTKFEITCKECSARGRASADSSIIQFHFKKGVSCIEDTMIVFCAKCGNRIEIIIEWHL
jgi:DNA-directed RNA polymerase subunit RPC12/RpoP